MDEKAHHKDPGFLIFLGRGACDQKEQGAPGSVKAGSDRGSAKPLLGDQPQENYRIFSPKT